MKSSTRNKSWLKWILLLVILVIALVWYYKRQQAVIDDTPLGVGTVRRMDLEQRVTISGQISPKKRLDVKPPFAGYVQKLYVKVGDKVKNHDPLATFSQTLAGGENNFPVRAVFDGVVTQVLKTEGEYVTDQGEQNMVVRVEDLSSLSVLAAVPELDIAKVKRGQAAMVRVSALMGETFPGEINEIALGAKDKQMYSSASTEFQIRVLLKSHDPRLLPGMSALMDVITDDRENVLTLPFEYIQDESGKYFVTTDKGVRKPITLGLQTEEAAEIKSGVVEGERVRVIDFLNLPKTEE